MNLTDLKGIGPVRAESLRAMGIVSLRDLLFTLPACYEDHHTVYPCATKEPGMIMISGKFRDPVRLTRFHGISRVSGSLTDETGSMPVCWFNAPWIMQQIHPGETIRLFGRMSIKNGKRQLQNPKIVTDDGWFPVYKTNRSVPEKTFRKLMMTGFSYLEDCCPETLPREFRLQHHLCELNFALREAHFPASMNNLEMARRRLSFERILLYLLYVSMAGNDKLPAHSFEITARHSEQYWSFLPFEPTSAQKKVLSEIMADLQKPFTMARLVQGDVGSGKTAVAFGSIWLSYTAGYQSAMMAPTEILAVQHYESARRILEPHGVVCRLLTGSTKPKDRRAILTELKEGTCNAVFGTHALISKDVVYQQLGLVITDEQHRFGVRQRSMLHEKGESKDHSFPHVLVLSATPIPRTLALILYGDLDISVIDELPKGRIPVRTRIVPETKRSGMYGFLRERIREGRQAYIVCPSVEDSENNDELHSAKAVFEQLKDTALKDVRAALTWGGQKGTEKEQILHDFAEGCYDVLVSTTVIEVGINNPNATIMIIEDAERFGLSQLHQLRGRVGRGEIESWCFLLSEASEKMSILCKTNDGFEISRKDLELRGPGDMMGTRQSGDAPGTDLIGGDAKLLEEVSRAVKQLHEDPSQQATLQLLNRYAESYFHESGHGIALN